MRILVFFVMIMCSHFAHSKEFSCVSKSKYNGDYHIKVFANFSSQEITVARTNSYGERVSDEENIFLIKMVNKKENVLNTRGLFSVTKFIGQADYTISISVDLDTKAGLVALGHRDPFSTLPRWAESVEVVCQI